MQIKRLKTTWELSIKIDDPAYRRMVYAYFCTTFKGKCDTDLFHIVSKSWEYLLDWHRKQIKDALSGAISKEPNVFQITDHAAIRNLLHNLTNREK